MSENLDMMRAGQAGFSSGDLSAVKHMVSEDVEWGTTGAFPGLEQIYRGREALDEWMDQVRSAWEWFEVTTDEVLRDEEGVLVVAERLRGRGRGSGIEVEMVVFSVYRIEDGLIVSRRVYEDRDKALEAGPG